MLDLELSESQQECLRAQTITDEQPGTVLRDFRMLLDFLGPDGIESSGIHRLLPIKSIEELDRRLSRPLHLKLKRPLIKSHAYIQGLNLLLRASGLCVVETAGTKPRLVLDQAMLMQWDQLNPTEQYFNLLEAWLRIGSAEMFDGYRRDGTLLQPCIGAWRRVPAEGQRFDLKEPQDVSLFGIHRDFYNVALMDLFGLMSVEHAVPPSAPWCPAAVGHLPFGDAVFTLLFPRCFAFLRTREDDGDEDENDHVGWLDQFPRFGAWQPLFEPYFPEWQDNLEITRPEPRDGTFIFRVSLGKIWRLIAMPADCTLGDLVALILQSVRFDDDHLYEITYRDRTGSKVKVGDGHGDRGPSAHGILIGTIALEPGDKLELLYDFGDNWKFDVKLVRIDPPGRRTKAPKIIEKQGKSPAQYERWED